MKFSRKYKIKRKKPFYKKKIFLFSLFLIFLFFLNYFFLFSYFFQIKEFKILGAEKIKEEDLENFLEKKIKKEILIFNTKSIFLINLKDFKEEMLNIFPQIEEVSFKRKFPDIIEVIIKERKPIAFYHQKDEYFLIDRFGIIFEKINIEENSNFFTIEKENQKESKLGEMVISPETIKKILEIEEGLKKLNLECKLFKIPSEERINAQTNKGFEIYFTLSEKISVQLFYLQVLLKEKISEEKIEDLEYIDLRFGNRIFFKYKD